MKYPNLGFDPQDFYSLYRTDRSDNDLMKLLLFAIFVAGKSSKTTAKGLDTLLYFAHNDMNKDVIQNIVCLGKERFVYLCKQHGLGCYNQRWDSVCSIDEFLWSHNLKDVSVDQLKEIKGVGNKTARFFLLYSRPFQKFAVIDTHIWKFLRETFPEAPEKPPTSDKEYKKWEKTWVEIVPIKLYRKGVVQSPSEYAQADFNGWKQYVS